MIFMEEICRFADTDIHKNNYKQGERILKSSDNFFFCGKTSKPDKNSNMDENAVENTDENAEENAEVNAEENADENAEENEGHISIIAKCIGTSGLRDDPHSIQGKIMNTGKILSMLCSCKAGEGEKCKHVMATLLFIYK